MAKVEWDQSKINMIGGLLREGARYIAFPAAIDLLAAMKDRIFVQGLDSQNKKISPAGYSDEDLYLYETMLARSTLAGGRNIAFRPRGKFGDTIHYKGNNAWSQPDPSGKAYRNAHSWRTDPPTAYKMMYFRGWKEAREMMGRQTESVDLIYTGSLMSAIKLAEKNEKNTDSYYSTRIDIVIANQTEIDKSFYLEKMYGKAIFTPSRAEITDYENTIARRIRKIITDSL